MPRGLIDLQLDVYVSVGLARKYPPGHTTQVSIILLSRIHTVSRLVDTLTDPPPERAT